MNTELVSTITSSITAASALGVAIMAFLGVNTWRKELTGKAKFELAKSIMVLSRKIQAEFEWARFPMTLSGEHSNRPKLENESSEKSSEISRILDLYDIRGQRLKPLGEDLAKLQEATWEAESVLDKSASAEVSKVFVLLKSKYADLITGLEAYFEVLYDGARGRDVSIHQEWLKELGKEIYKTKDDSFSKDIEEAVTNLSFVLKPYLK
jgi:hypothetical protein